MDLNKIRLSEKVNYINDSGVDTIYGEDMILDYISNNGLSSLSTLKNMVIDIDLDYEYFKIDGYGYPETITDEEIEEMFEEYLDDIVENSSIKDDYPEIFSESKENENIRL